MGAGPVARRPEAAGVRRVKRAAVEVNSAAGSHAVDVALDGAVARDDTVGAHADRPGRRTARGIVWGSVSACFSRGTTTSAA